MEVRIVYDDFTVEPLFSSVFKSKVALKARFKPYFSTQNCFTLDEDSAVGYEKTAGFY